MLKGNSATPPICKCIRVASPLYTVKTKKEGELAVICRLQAHRLNIDKNIFKYIERWKERQKAWAVIISFLVLHATENNRDLVADAAMTGELTAKN